MIERRDSGASSRPAQLPAAVWLFGAASLVLHLLPRPGYGFHRDELLYLAMGDHLELLRMQFPPVIAVLAQLARALPIDRLVAIHLASATVTNPMGVLEEQEVGVHLCRRPHQPLLELWRSLGPVWG